jgi:hypothetical protein
MTFSLAADRTSFDPVIGIPAAVIAVYRTYRGAF